MDGLAEFFSMGGYASYIWPAYIIAGVIMVGVLATSVRDLRRNEGTLESLRAERRGAFTDEADQ